MGGDTDFTLFNKMAIIGVGLIGGSIALKLKELKLVNEVIGFGRSEQNLEDAKKLGIIDAYYRDFSHLKDVDIVIVATPVASIVHIIKQIAPLCKKGAIVTDVGSVKEEIVKQVINNHINNIHFVPAHPIAGTENSGAKSAFSSLFEGKRCILTPKKETDQTSLTMVRMMWERLGAEVVVMGTNQHDRIFAAISHLPHIIAYALVNCADNMKDIDENILGYSAGGFLDFTRIASSDPEMWRDICLLNKSNILEMLERFEATLSEIKKAVKSSDGHRIYEDFHTSKTAREKLLHHKS
ncbi:prephenate dehydrogenase [Thermodesulfobacteriota bacterium]